MTEDNIRIGIIGAGKNTCQKHIPFLQKISGVSIVSVCNRSSQSSKIVADKYSIPQVCTTWKEIIEDESIDAVVIGTWPYMHHPITCAALDHNKHVLCEARMAMNAAEAHDMLAKSRENQGLVAQIVPAPYTLLFDEIIIEQISKGELGELLVINLKHSSPDFINPASPMTWRQNVELSGKNVMSLGIMYESLARWIGHATGVIAFSKTFVKQRRDDEYKMLTSLMIPDHLDVIAEFACGAQANFQFSSVTGLAHNYSEIWLFGSEGTLFLDLQHQQLFKGKRHDKSLVPLNIPDHKKGSWRVEEEFINTIRGKEKTKLTTFEEGVRYMEFTEAVNLSSTEGKRISLPLR